MNLLRLKRLLTEKYPRSRSALYDDIARGIFVPSIALGPRSVAWLESEVNAVIAARTAALDDADMRQMVSQLVAARCLPDAAAVQQQIVYSSIGAQR